MNTQRPSSSMPIRLGSEKDLALLFTLQTLLETRSVSKAAEQLGIAQPALSRSLARLRDRFGDPLLIRVQGKMVLTPRAEALKEPLGAWLADGRQLFAPKEMEPTALQRSFRVSSTDFGVLSVIQPALSQITKSAPGVELIIDPLGSSDYRKLANGELDIVITGRDPDLSLAHAKKLFQERHVCLARKDHPFLHDGRMTIADFFACPHVVIRLPGGIAADYEESYPAAHRRRLVVSDNFMLAPYLVADSDAVMTAPSRAAAYFSKVHDLAQFEAPAPLPEFGYWLQWHERTERDPEVQWLIHQLEQAVQVKSADHNPTQSI